MRLFVTLMIAAALALSAACGSGEDDVEPTATFPPGFTPQPPGLLTPGPPPTLTPGDSEFVSYTSPNLSYSVSLPKAFVTEGNDRFLYATPDKGPVAEISVTCQRPGVISGQGGTPSEDPKNLLQEDAALLREVEAPLSSGEATEATVDGKAAVRWPYVVALAGGNARVNQFVWYVGDTPCTWRLRTIVYGLEPVDAWEEIFERVMESFDADASQIPLPSGSSIPR